MTVVSSTLVRAGGLCGLVVAACSGARGKPSPTCPSSAAFQGAVNDHGSVPSRGATDSVIIDDAFFSPTCITGVAAGTVTLVLTNRGRILHNISFPDQAIDQDVAPGETFAVQVHMAKHMVGFNCKYHRLAGMAGSLMP